MSRNWANKLNPNLISGGGAMIYLQIVYKNKEFMFPQLPEECKISKKKNR